MCLFSTHCVTSPAVGAGGRDGWHSPGHSGSVQGMETKRYGAKFIIMSHRQWVQRKKKGQLWGTLQKVLESQKALCVWG